FLRLCDKDGVSHGWGNMILPTAQRLSSTGSARAEDRGQRPRLQRAFSPGAKDESADRESNEWTAHVDENQRPRICFEGGEHANGRIFNEQEGEPADERDLQTSDGIRRVEPAN